MSRRKRMQPYIKPGEIINSDIFNIKDLSSEVFNKEYVLHESHSKLVAAHASFQSYLNEIVDCENKLRKRVDELQTAKNELDEMATDMGTLYHYENEKHNAELNAQVALAMQHTIKVQTQIDHIKEELDSFSPIVPESRNKNCNAYHCYNKVIIPPPLPDEMMPGTSILENNVNVCSVCLQNPVDRIIIGCGHMCLCSTCAPRLLGETEEENEKCPICRSHIEAIIEPQLVNKLFL